MSRRGCCNNSCYNNCGYGYNRCGGYNGYNYGGGFGGYGSGFGNCGFGGCGGFGWLPLLLLFGCW